MKRGGGRVIAAVPRWRFRVISGFLALMLASLLWRMMSLQVWDFGRGVDFLQDQGDARSIRTESIPAHRGMITDRHGQPLAVSTPVKSIWLDPKLLDRDEAKLRRLAALADLDYQRLSAKLERYNKHRFLYLRRHLPPAAAQKILDLGIRGVYSQDEYRRYYPAGEVTAQLLGFTNIDDQGQEGLELAYEQWLRGESGKKRVLKDLHGNIIRELDAGKLAAPGKDLRLSIDLRLQYMAYRELKAALKRNQAKAGSVVMLDANTGEVLAMVNQPSFNPNNRKQLSSGALRNRAITDMFEPGSTVKPLTVAAALESGLYRPDTLIDTNPGHIRVGKKTLVDPVNYGVLDVTAVLAKSSQVGTSKMALDLEQQALWSLFDRVGLGRSSGVGFPGEAEGLLPVRERWREIERANFAFGYGLAVTSLQLAQAYTVLANDGQLRSASLLKLDAEDSVSQGSAQVISEPVARQVLAMLETVTQSGGTGTRAAVDTHRVAGKTGTVHKLSNGSYSDRKYLALFAGMAPVSEPRVVTVVTIDEPQRGGYYGGEVAAPVFAKVTADAMRLLNVAPDKLPATLAEHAVVGQDGVEHQADLSVLRTGGAG